MSELFSKLPSWYYFLLGIGLLDALIQFADYMHWRKERSETEETSE